MTQKVWTKGKELPCWLYHATEKPIIVHNKTLLTEKMANGWYKSPAHVPGFIDTPGIAETRQAVKEAHMAGFKAHEESADKAAVNEIGKKVQVVVDEANTAIQDRTKVKENLRELEKAILEEFGEDVDLRRYRGVKGLAKLNNYYNELKEAHKNDDSPETDT